jgi:alkylation response protein AidB-like acyl-CoA dehydrogenase
MDEVGKGWQVAMTTLMHERGAGPLVTPASGSRRAESSTVTGSAIALIDLAKNTQRGGKTAADDPIIRDRIMSLVIRQRGFTQSVRRARVRGLTDHPMRIPQQGKLVMTELMQEITALSLEIEGASSTLYVADSNAPAGGEWPASSTLYVADSNAPAGGEWPLAYMNSYGMTIAAGTSEVIRNILGERVLGLPKSR